MVPVPVPVHVMGQGRLPRRERGRGSRVPRVCSGSCGGPGAGPVGRRRRRRRRREPLPGAAAPAYAHTTRALGRPFFCDVRVRENSRETSKTSSHAFCMGEVSSACFLYGRSDNSCAGAHLRLCRTYRLDKFSHDRFLGCSTFDLTDDENGTSSILYVHIRYVYRDRNCR